MQKYSSSSYQEAARTRERGLLGNVTDSLISGNGSITGSIGRGISKTFKAKVTGIKEKFDPMNIAKKLTGNTGSALIGRATGRSREDMEYFAGQSPRGRSAAAHQYTKTGPDLGELSKALYTKVSEGQQPKLKSGDSVSNVMGKLYNLVLINSKLDYDAREEDKQKKIQEDELKEKQHKEILKALTGTGRPVSVKKEKKEEGKSFLDMIGDMIKGIITTIKEMIDNAIKGIELLKAAGPLLAIVGAGYLGYKFGDEFVRPLIDKMIQFNTGDKDATLGTATFDKVEQFKKNFFGIKTDDDKLNDQFFNDTVNAATKNKNTIDEDVRNNLLSKDWVRNDPAKVAALKGFRIKFKQDKSPTVIAGEALSEDSKGRPKITGTEYNSSTGVAKFKVDRNRQPVGVTPSSETPALSGTTTAAPVPPQPNPISERIIDATTKNNDARLSEDTAPKMINIDNSKKMGVGSSAPAIGMDSSVSVRIDDPTLQKIQKQSLRPV